MNLELLATRLVEIEEAFNQALANVNLLNGAKLEVKGWMKKLEDGLAPSEDKAEDAA